MVTRENIGLLNDKLVVKIEKSDYLPSFEKALKEYGKKANIPGFRKGMVPASLVKKMYGTSVFTDEVLKSVEKNLTEYVTAEHLEIFAQPLPLPENDAPQINMNQPGEYSFSFEVGLKPEFQLPELSSIAPSRYKIAVTDELLDTEIDRLRQKNGTMTEPETVGNEEYVLNVSFEEIDEQGNPVEGGLKKDNSLLVKYFAEAFRAGLLGKKNGDVVTVKVADAFEDKERGWVLQDLGLNKDSAEDAAKTFAMTITKVGLLEKAGLDEELYKKVFPSKEIKSESEFREAVREDMSAQWKTQTDNQLHHSIYHELLDHTTIEFPESFLKRWLLNGGEKPKTPPEVENEYPSFVTALKWSLITEKLGQGNDFEVGPDEIKAAARVQLFSYLGGLPQGGDQPWIEDYVTRMMQDRRFVDETYQRLKTEKMFRWVESQISPVDKTISAEEFNAMQAEHQHTHGEEAGHDHSEHEGHNHEGHDHEGHDREGHDHHAH